jgi:hypothetical protein
MVLKIGDDELDAGVLLQLRHGTGERRVLGLLLPHEIVAAGEEVVADRRPRLAGIALPDNDDNPSNERFLRIACLQKTTPHPPTSCFTWIW